jgi:hypothetical protein
MTDKLAKAPLHDDIVALRPEIRDGLAYPSAWYLELIGSTLMLRLRQDLDWAAGRLGRRDLTDHLL